MSVTLPDTYPAWCGTCGKMRPFGVTDGRCVASGQHPVAVPVRLCSTCFEWTSFLFTTGECGACFCDRKWAEFTDRRRGTAYGPSARRETSTGGHPQGFETAPASGAGPGSRRPATEGAQQ